MNCSKKLKGSELLELIAWGRAELLRAGIEEAQEECERILMKLCGCSRSRIYLEEHELDASGTRERFLALLEKRVQRIPLEYLLKEADFWQETLYVDERCLIPRPETEILVEVVIREIGKAPPPGPLPGGEGKKRTPLLGERLGEGENVFSFLDIGTGSGAIAIVRAFKNAYGTMLDISGEALEVAFENLKRYKLEERAVLVQGNIFNGSGEVFPHPGPLPEGEGKNRKPLPGGEGGGRGLDKWDLIVSNPPYLSEEDWKEVQEELRFEPKGALDGGKDGLDFYRKIISGAKDRLTCGGMIALEVGQGQTEQVSKWLQTAGYDNIQRFKDLLGIERVVIARKGTG